jgi:hypothetical protein
MKRHLRIIIALCLCCVGLQSIFAQTPSPNQAAPIYNFGSEVAPPQIIPFVGDPPAVTTCKQKVDGNVLLSLEIDPTGAPQSVMFVKPNLNDLDRLAIKVATADRFNPGTLSGAAVSVKASLELRFQTCLELSTDPSGVIHRVLHLRAWPRQTLGEPEEPKLAR